MLCKTCGKEIADDVTFCPHCGNSTSNPADESAPETVRINTWLVPAILATVCCCMPFGVVSIVYAVGANTEVSNRNFALAQEKADKAKTWFWVSFICGFVINFAYCLLNFAAGFAKAALR